MPPLEVRKYLFDIQQACQRLVEFTAGKTFDDFVGSALLRSAVERQFEIIGEALHQMLRVDPSMASAISDTKRIISFRNRLIHGYATISDAVVWGVVQTSLPTLHREIESLLSQQE
jgi:uncharacterized protein with HEPN domain